MTCYGNATRDINCSANQTIVILNADYGGLADMKTCGYNENINRNISATCLVKNQCDGKQWCNITVDHRLFKVDPFPGKSKYLYIEHKCVDKDSFSKPFGTGKHCFT